MARKSFEVPIGPPYRGINTRIDARKLPPTFLTAATDCDLTNGDLRGAWGNGTTITTLGANRRFLFYHPGVGWLHASVLQPDGMSDSGLRAPDDAIGQAVSYITQLSGSGGNTASTPRMYVSTNNYKLGVDAPIAAPTQNTAGTGSSRAYKYTYVNKSLSMDIESNPSPVFTTTACTNIKLNLVNPGIADVTHQRIYGTAVGTTTGDFYLLQEVTVGTIWQDVGPMSPTEPAGATVLNWGSGGYYTNTAMPSDHGIAPNLTCLSDSLHAAAGDGAQGTGVLFGAATNTVYWSRLGLCYYWPAVNSYRLTSVVHALVTMGTETFALTTDGIWSFSGASDIAMSVSKTPAHLGIRTQAGKTACRTPDGIVYLSPEGITLFDGIHSRVISAGLIDPHDFLLYDFWTGAYYGGFYYLSAASGFTYVVDMRNLENVSIVKSSVNASAFYVSTHDSIADADTTTHTGLYVAWQSSGDVRPWRPAETNLVGGAVQANFDVTTAKLDCGHPNKRKRFSRIRAYGNDVTLTLSADPGYGAPTSFSVALTFTQQLYRLPAEFEGRTLQVRAQATSGTAELYDLAVQMVVFDGA